MVKCFLFSLGIEGSMRVKKRVERNEEVVEVGKYCSLMELQGVESVMQGGYEG